MITTSSIKEYRQLTYRLPRPIGFVPTMGSLHEGHLSLVRAARKDCKTVIVSVFVNPAQFGPGEDFATYPRNIEKDGALLTKEGVDVLFTPAVNEIYLPDHDTWIEVGGVAKRLEGETRPGHFRGVATVVLKLFNIISPDKAYFGQKDAQQTLVIRKMAQDLNLKIGIETLPTIRTPEGLALSSRNHYLSNDEKVKALALYQSLKLAKELHDNGERDASVIKTHMQTLLSAAGIKTDYISVADRRSLEELNLINEEALVLLAGYVGRTRLIDNILLGKQP